jgi:hypothetical protein
MDDDAPYRRDDRSEFRGSEPRRSSGREREPLDQRLDRWVSAGRQFVDGVAGGRPGSRPPARSSEARNAGRGSEARMAGRGGFDGLGRWVEERLDWLLEDDDDWREPWQDTGPDSPAPLPRSRPNARNLSNPDTRFNPADLPTSANPVSAARPLSATDPASAARSRNQTSRTNPDTNAATAADSMPRRRLEARSRRGLTPQSPAVVVEMMAAGDRESESEVWPDDDSFSLPHWQRPVATGRAPEPSPPVADTFDGGGRPLPRSSRRTSRRPGA